MAINVQEVFDDISGQFRDLNGLHPGLWPIAPRAAAALLVLVVVLIAGWFVYWDGQTDEINQKVQEEVKLKQDYKDKMQQAINLDALIDQRGLVQQYVATMEKQLPSKAEMDALLSDINQAGTGRGLQFDSFKPGGAIVKDYYAELPIEIKLNGSYHDLGEFVADIAKLPRIVTLNNLSVSTNKDGLLTLDVVAKTFRYLDKDEVLAQANLKKAVKK
ncbi:MULTISPECIES: type 4a pilus biogenesis protein PilO [unclassified Undibacterium]|uniref:type 4a pilus biogenesis protein PilO n=1 Tax=unclassified Undibacterium TaxID=2630295 RepID=UPI002AC8DB5B|nr:MULTISPECIES: type 4a pilus biogenesis protein PilO [unclassified Undibacterium]MEB0137534.1 type 4a pilus biogenesis protein PilO [Undibacterium sp. CCC2.1]MEB0170801.1 type 4a pilus biogenesis protein PilO [Undibacterium sp. CCC1.1]MEB0174753.1 type 4a pilus biogenesis protein PilO [Undibacterium sp. CCC3.4]MEB0214089.1 type 4a pilus biogenesis protein PilO [Undibacterium sp. 5I2]WPX44405.1 type 4a pilus biogenesis protein PilO [Undibacterium sp. CCC3.4]